MTPPTPERRRLADWVLKKADENLKLTAENEKLIRWNRGFQQDLVAVYNKLKSERARVKELEHELAFQKSIVIGSISAKVMNCGRCSELENELSIAIKTKDMYLRATKDDKDLRIKVLGDALISIEEYWNSEPTAAVDAAEEMRFRAREALAGKEKR